MDFVKNLERCDRYIFQLTGCNVYRIMRPYFSFGFDTDGCPGAEGIQLAKGRLSA